MCALRPPFLGDSFPALKRAVTLGRYPSIPNKYTEPLHNVIAQMLKLSPRERPSADQLLKSPDVIAKLGLDDTVSNFLGGESENKSLLEMINTIKVPQNLNKLQGVLPKPCYPDLRPNSPTSWTVAEQRSVQRKPPPLPPVPNLPLSSVAEGRENAAPLPSYRSDDVSVASSVATNCGAKVAPYPYPAVDEIRRPLAPVSANRSNVAPHRSGDAKNLYFMNNKPAAFQPTLDPIPAPVVPPSLQMPTAPSAPKAAGNPSRLMYHHRAW